MPPKKSDKPKSKAGRKKQVKQTDQQLDQECCQAVVADSFKEEALPEIIVVESKSTIESPEQEQSNEPNQIEIQAVEPPSEELNKLIEERSNQHIEIPDEIKFQTNQAKPEQARPDQPNPDQDQPNTDQDQPNADQDQPDQADPAQDKQNSAKLENLSVSAEISNDSSSLEEHESKVEEEGLQNQELETEKMFSKILSFVEDLHHVFGTKVRSLQYFYRLLVKSSSTNAMQRIKYVDLFRSFCLQNQEAILKRSLTALSSRSIVYPKLVKSDKLDIQIDLGLLLSKADNDARVSIWDHLNILLACFAPSREHIDLIKSQHNNLASPEADLIKNIQLKVEASMSANGTPENPLSAIMGLAQSGALTQIVGEISQGVQGNQIDLGKMLATLQNVVGGLRP